MFFKTVVKERVESQELKPAWACLSFCFAFNRLISQHDVLAFAVLMTYGCLVAATIANNGFG
ncbi:MAG: hypothetical protein COB04_13785 [Gammaproteobacteria bacterium]|nr:MAG: hypothetical protein COB04_13785 [Gammaproteobacteria bacterium]